MVSVKVRVFTFLGAFHACSGGVTVRAPPGRPTFRDVCDPYVGARRSGALLVYHGSCHPGSSVAPLSCCLCKGWSCLHRSRATVNWQRTKLFWGPTDYCTLVNANYRSVQLHWIRVLCVNIYVIKT